MTSLLVSLAIGLYTSYGVYYEIYPLLGGDIKRSEFQYSIISNHIIYLYYDKMRDVTVKYSLRARKILRADPNGFFWG